VMLRAGVWAAPMMSTMPSSMFRIRRKILPLSPLLLSPDQGSMLWSLQIFATEEKGGMPFA
jgi:hypothetical protein